MVRVSLTRKRLRELNVSEDDIADVMSKGLHVATDRDEPQKYGNRSCRDALWGTNEWFQSEWEREVWYMLVLRQRAELIRNLRRQVPFKIVVNGLLICRYVADFVYDELRGEGELGKWTEVVEDAKGLRTKEYIIKQKLMRAVHGITIRETFREEK